MSEQSKETKAIRLDVKELLVEELLRQADAVLLAHADEDGVESDTARSRVLEAYRVAAQLVDGQERGGAAQGALHARAKRPKVLSIDAAKARAILKRVAARPLPGSAPFANAAHFNPVAGEEAVRTVTELRDLGVISDDDLT
jgi:hypothetical protein